MAQIDPKSGKLVKLHEIEVPSPQPVGRIRRHDLPRLQQQRTVLTGSRAATWRSRRPSGKIEGYGAGFGGNGGWTVELGARADCRATTAGELVVVGIESRERVQKIATSPGVALLGVNLVYQPDLCRHHRKGGLPRLHRCFRA